MAISDRLTKRFRNVPGVTATDITDWVAEAEIESGLTEGSADNTDTALLYLAFALGCEAIAIDAARYFKYGDDGESVDKSMIYANYSHTAERARKMYAKFRNGSGASYSYNVSRADGR